jgi:hypothetical protein
MRLVWLSIKALVSFLLVALAVGVLLVAPASLSDPAAFGGSAVLVFFAALPWLNFTRLSRPLGLLASCFRFSSTLFLLALSLGKLPFQRYAAGAVSSRC